MVLSNDIQELFKIVRTQLGAPIRSVQLTDDQLCDLLKVVVGDYAEKVQNWAIEVQWLGAQGKPMDVFQNPMELAYAMTVRMFDWTIKWSSFFSKEQGLQQRSSYWELKKDFFRIEKGKQVYVVPAGREINKVLYITPSTTKAALYGNLGTLDTGIGGGYGQFGSAIAGMGIQGFYVGNAYDTALMAADLKYKNSLLRGDLAYKVTAGPDGTHLIHLMSVPGSKNSMNSIAVDDRWGWNQYANCFCWYTYYDTSTSSGDSTQCLIDNRDSVIITPDQVPMSEMRYELMNNPTQQLIRRLLTAEAKITLGIVRGTNSGRVAIPNAELQLDYQMLLEQGKAEKEQVLNDLKERLDRMTPWNLMEKQAGMMENMMKTFQFKTPTKLYIR